MLCIWWENHGSTAFYRVSVNVKLDSVWKKRKKKRGKSNPKMKRWMRNCIQSNCIGGKCTQNKRMNMTCSESLHLNWCLYFLPFSPTHSDTPHHLKNKRVQHGAIDKAAATILLANVPKPLDTVPTNVINDSSNISDRGGEQKSSHSNECGKFCMLLLLSHVFNWKSYRSFPLLLATVAIWITQLAQNSQIGI